MIIWQEMVVGSEEYKQYLHDMRCKQEQQHKEEWKMMLKVYKEGRIMVTR